MLLIITSTSDKLFKNVNIDDLKWPWILKILVFSDFLAIFDCKKVNYDEIDIDRPRLLAKGNCYKLSRVSWALAQFFVIQRQNWLQVHKSVKRWNAAARLYSVAMGQIPRSTERISSWPWYSKNIMTWCWRHCVFIVLHLALWDGASSFIYCRRRPLNQINCNALTSTEMTYSLSATGHASRPAIAARKLALLVYSLVKQNKKYFNLNF